MREIRTSGSEGGARSIPCPYPYRVRARRPVAGWFSGAFGWAEGSGAPPHESPRGAMRPFVLVALV